MPKHSSNLTRLLGASGLGLAVGLLFQPYLAFAQAQTRQIDLTAGLLIGEAKEPTGWGYPAAGQGWNIGLRYRDEIVSFPFLLDLTYGTFTGRQQALKDLTYRGQPMFTEQRFGLSYADVECANTQGAFIWTPSLFKTAGTTLRLRAGLWAGNSTLAWLHPVTTTRVYVFRNFAAPAVGLQCSGGRLQGDYHTGLTWRLWADMALAEFSQAFRRTNEGETASEQPVRFSGPGGNFNYSLGIEGQYFVSCGVGLGAYATTQQVSFAGGGQARVRQTGFGLSLTIRLKSQDSDQSAP